MATQFHTLLVSPMQDIHLIHCTEDPEKATLSVEVAVIEAGVDGNWALVTSPDGDELYVDLPPDVQNQGHCWKAYHLNIPCKKGIDGPKGSHPWIVPQAA